MKENPFLSTTFSSIWVKHFGQDKQVFALESIKGPQFVKSKSLPLYINIGATHTKGMSYVLDRNGSDYKGKTILVYDVPGYFPIEGPTFDNIERKRVKQYPGYLIDLKDYNGLDDYMTDHFSKSSRYKLRKYQKRLEQCFDIRVHMIKGEVSEIEYNEVFRAFRQLLEKRFSEKRISNNNLETKEWAFYKEVALPLIREGRAGLFIIYDGQMPIGITLVYFYGEVVLDAITVFDIDYAKFHLGTVNIMKLIDWCAQGGYRILDFSKGEFDYKSRWCTQEYDFSYDILYDPQSVPSRILAGGLTAFFQCKQRLREKKWNEKFHRMTYRLRHRQPTEIQTGYNFEKIGRLPTKERLIELDFMGEEQENLRKCVYEFLYLNPGKSRSDTRFYKIPDTQEYFIEAGNLICKVTR